MSQFEQKKNPDQYRLYPRPTFLLLYKEPRQQYNRISNLNRSRSESDGLSRNSAMKMRRAISWLVASAERKMVYEKRFKKKVQWRVNMITLTLPMQADLNDKQCKRLMNTFFKWACYNGLSNYVWRAELQKRGVIHFHIITDWYVHYTNLKHAWNRILSKSKLLNNHADPNSTDVHAVLDNQVKDLTAYVIDYMQKKDGNGDRKIKGRLWGCSRQLSKAGKRFVCLEEPEDTIVHDYLKANNWECSQIEDTACFMYRHRQSKNPYKFIDKNDDIYTIYQDEIKAIRSKNKQLEMYERSDQ